MQGKWIKHEIEIPSPNAWFLAREVAEEKVPPSYTSFKVLRLTSWTGLRRKEEER